MENFTKDFVKARRIASGVTFLADAALPERLAIYKGVRHPGHFPP